MGACYYVKLKVKVLDEQGAINALNEYIDKTKYGVNYSLDKYKEQGITTETFDGLMKIFLAGWDYNNLEIDQKRIYTYYENDFDASYGWEGVMMEMFEVITPYVKDGSELLIYPDSDYDKLIVKNGKCVQIH